MNTLLARTSLPQDGTPEWVFTPGDDSTGLPHAWRLYSDGEGSTWTLFGFHAGADHVIPELIDALEHPDPEAAGLDIAKRWAEAPR